MPQVDSVSMRGVARSMKRAVNGALDHWRYRSLVHSQVFPNPLRTILVVCKGNICRSPLVEAYLKHQVEKHGLPITVESAGLETSYGKTAHPLAQLVGTQCGLLLSQHATQQLHKEQVEPYSGTLEDFQTCFSMIKQACDVLVMQMLPPGKQA